MTERLEPNDHQQEDRAAQAKSLAESLEGQAGVDVVLKGESLTIRKSGKDIIVTANGDASFTIKDGPSHLGENELLTYVADA